MKFQLFILAAFITIGMGSCKNGNLNDPQSSNITGQWHWVKSVGGIGGITLTPQSTGYNLRDEFYADNTYKRYKNDTLLVQDRYAVSTNYKYSATENINVLYIGPNKTAFVIRNDTLYINQLFISDGFSEVYVKIK